MLEKAKVYFNYIRLGLEAVLVITAFVLLYMYFKKTGYTLQFTPKVSIVKATNNSTVDTDTVTTANDKGKEILKKVKGKNK